MILTVFTIERWISNDLWRTPTIEILISFDNNTNNLLSLRTCQVDIALKTKRNDWLRKTKYSLWNGGRCELYKSLKYLLAAVRSQSKGLSVMDLEFLYLVPTKWNILLILIRLILIHGELKDSNMAFWISCKEKSINISNQFF